MKRNLFPICALLLFSAFTFISCQKETSLQPATPESFSIAISSAKPADKTNTFYGPQTQIADGKARSFIILSGDGIPQELGIEITADAFSRLPVDGHSAFQLSLHQKAMDVTAFDHIVMNWNPNGHPPESLFGVPHFDFHFFTISKEAQLAIPPYALGSLHDLLPPHQYWPVGHIPLPGGEPEMGKHWADITHPVTEGSFTHTMIYGSYNGAMTFVEPMITRAYLLTLTEKVSVPYNQPLVYTESHTWYPTVYNMYTNENRTKYYITLSNFILSH